MKPLVNYLGLTSLFILSVTIAVNTYLSVDPKIISTAAGTVASVCSTLLGFIIAAVTILMSLSTQPFIQKLKRYGHYTTLLKNMKQTAVLLFTCTVLALVQIFTSNIDMQRLGTAVLAFALVFTAAAFIRSTSRLWKVMEVLGKTYK